tara:strand:- start:1875 stop:1997 length:123 start_codon:yes stop_codon:yes gene_type:complete
MRGRKTMKKKPTAKKSTGLKGKQNKLPAFLKKKIKKSNKR